MPNDFAHLLPPGEASDIAVGCKLGVEAEITKELLYGCHGQGPGRLTHLHRQSESKGKNVMVEKVITSRLDFRYCFQLVCHHMNSTIRWSLSYLIVNDRPLTFCSEASFPSYSLTSFSKPRSTSSSRVIQRLNASEDRPIQAI